MQLSGLTGARAASAAQSAQRLRLRNQDCYQRRWPATTMRRVTARAATAETAATLLCVFMLCGWAQGLLAGLPAGLHS